MKTEELRNQHQQAIRLLDAIDEMGKRKQAAKNMLHYANGTVFYTEEYLRNLADTRQRAIERLWKRYHILNNKSLI